MPHDIATSKEFHLHDDLSVFSRQVLKETDPTLNPYLKLSWVQKQMKIECYF